MKNHYYPREIAAPPSLLQRVPTQLPYGKHTTHGVFISLMAGCSIGDPESMWDMAEHFEALYRKQQHPFFQLAAVFWRGQAFRNGSPDAAQWFHRWEEAHPGIRPEAPLDETRAGEDLDGRLLNQLGYPAFIPEARYDIKPADNLGIVRICRYPYDADYFEAGLYEYTYYDMYLNSLHLDSEFFHPQMKPDETILEHSLFRIKRKAIKRSLRSEEFFRDEW